MADQPKVEQGSGRWRAARRRGRSDRRSSEGANGAGAEQIEVLNPANGSLLATVAVDSPASVAEKVARVRASQPEWEALGIEGRYYWLGKLRDWLLDNQERVLDTMQAETGKVRADATNEPPISPT